METLSALEDASVPCAWPRFAAKIKTHRESPFKICLFVHLTAILFFIILLIFYSLGNGKNGVPPTYFHYPIIFSILEQHQVATLIYLGPPNGTITIYLICSPVLSH